MNIVKASKKVNLTLGAALMQDQTAVNVLGNSVKDAVAGQSTHMAPEHVTVELKSGSLIIDIRVLVQSATNFLDIWQAMKDNHIALQKDILARINNMSLLNQYKDQTTPISIEESEFNLPQSVSTTTQTEITMSTTIENTSTTVNTETTTSLSYQVRVLSIILMPLTAFLAWA